MKIGIDLGGSHIAIGVVDETGRIVEKFEKRITNIEKQDIKKSIEETIIEHSNQFMDKYKINEMGIAVPGWAENGIIVELYNMKIKNYPIIEILQEKIKIPIKIKNDAKCAAIAEKEYGCLKEYDDSLFLTLGTGIGGAVFNNGKLLKSKRKPAYEVGHMVIEKNGIQCTCGRKGCFERYASMKVFKNNLRNALGYDENIRGEQLLEIIRQSTQKNREENKQHYIIEKVITEYIDNLNTGIQNLINIFEPEIIGIGGSFVHFQDILLPKLKEKLPKHIIVETAVLGNDAGIIGATL